MTARTPRNPDDDGPELVEFDHERPLDSLIPELAESRAPLPRTPIHPRVLELEDDDDGWRWLLCAWHDPGGARAFHTALQPLVEATLLSALSRPPACETDLRERRYRDLTLVVFDEVDHLDAAVRAFGLQRVADDQGPGPALAALVDEGRQMGWTLADAPRSIWRAPVLHPDDALGTSLDALADEMNERMGDDEVWGATPGGPSKLLAALLERDTGTAITPDLAGLDALEALLVQQRTGGIRWIPPVLFQALCDFLGIVAHNVFGAILQWAVCEADAHGLYPPPHLRWLPRGPTGEGVYVPLGLHVLRWCVMPVQPGEVVPSLSSWVSDQFGTLPDA